MFICPFRFKIAVGLSPTQSVFLVQDRLSIEHRGKGALEHVTIGMSFAAIEETGLLPALAQMMVRQTEVVVDFLGGGLQDSVIASVVTPGKAL